MTSAATICAKNSSAATRSPSSGSRSTIARSSATCVVAKRVGDDVGRPLVLDPVDLHAPHPTAPSTRRGTNGRPALPDDLPARLRHPARRHSCELVLAQRPDAAQQVGDHRGHQLRRRSRRTRAAAEPSRSGSSAAAGRPSSAGASPACRRVPTARLVRRRPRGGCAGCRWLQVYREQPSASVVCRCPAPSDEDAARHGHPDDVLGVSAPATAIRTSPSRQRAAPPRTRRPLGASARAGRCAPHRAWTGATDPPPAWAR